LTIRRSSKQISRVWPIQWLCSGYFMLGDVIEKVTGKSYADAIKAQIFDPLGMKNSGYDLFGPIITNRAAGYVDGLDGYENAPFLEMALPYSAGALYSTVEDMYLWDQALHGEKLLSAKYKKIMFTPALQGYAYGWGIQKHKYGKNGSDVDVSTHSGGINGFNTLITRMVKDNRMIVLLNNAGNVALRAMNTGLANILYGNANDQPKRSVAKVLYRKLKASDIKAMVKHYHDLQKNHSDDYVFHPGVLNSLGYQLLRQGSSGRF
jgi:CubicO group peptidase (beta-lactamase class C family)